MISNWGRTARIAATHNTRFFFCLLHWSSARSPPDLASWSAVVVSVCATFCTDGMLSNLFGTRILHARPYIFPARVIMMMMVRLSGRNLYAPGVTGNGGRGGDRQLFFDFIILLSQTLRHVLYAVYTYGLFGIFGLLRGPKCIYAYWMVMEVLTERLYTSIYSIYEEMLKNIGNFWEKYGISYGNYVFLGHSSTRM